MGLWGSDRGFDGFLMGFLGVPWVNGGSDRGFDGFMGVLWGSDRGFDGVLVGFPRDNLGKWGVG